MTLKDAQARHAELAAEIRRHDHAYYVLGKPDLTDYEYDQVHHMQRTFRDLNDPVMAITQAVIAFSFCLVFGLFYVRSVAKNRTP